MKFLQFIPVLFLVVFTLFWSSLVAVFDYSVCHDLWLAWHSDTYLRTEGSILSSTVKVHTSSKGKTSYAAEVVYRYRAQNRERQGTRINYPPNSNNGSYRARAFVAAHPEGSKCVVYYDPESPDQCVLIPGITGSGLFLLIFLTPFNLIPLVLVGSGIALLRNPHHEECPPGDIPVLETETVFRARIPQYQPWAVGLIMVFGLSFASIFLVGIPTAMNPGVAVVISTMILIWGSAAAVSLWIWRENRSGRKDLVIDCNQAVLTLPTTFSRKHPVLFPFQDCESIVLNRKVSSGKNGPRISYQTVLVPKIGRPEVLSEWQNQTKAINFARWISARSGIVFKDL